MSTFALRALEGRRWIVTLASSEARSGEME
jgi:hypothetical protein